MFAMNVITCVVFLKHQVLDDETMALCMFSINLHFFIV